MEKTIGILGSTGSIGVQALDVIRNLKNFKIEALTTNLNINLLEQQIREFKPKIVCVMDYDKAIFLKQQIKDLKTKVVFGKEGLLEITSLSKINFIINSLVGNIGLEPTICAIKFKKDIALANKETLVSAGEFVMNEAKKNNVNIYPIDSEHSAIFQCLQGNLNKDVKKIILTASGGPFRDFLNLKDVTLEQALKHPNWSMGKKITIDSATLMNKGLEVIEAKWLFDLEPSQIDVVVHRQSIVHSMVEFNDSSVIAQLGTPDMKVPIQYALTYPNRIKNDFPKLDLVKIGTLTFENPNYKLFPTLNYAFNALKQGGTMPAVLNASNEVAVLKFLNKKISFIEIFDIIKKTMDAHIIKKEYTLQDVFIADNWARDYALNL